MAGWHFICRLFLCRVNTLFDCGAGVIAVNKTLLRRRTWRVGSPFVVHLEGRHGIRFLDEGGVSDDCSSTEEDF